MWDKFHSILFLKLFKFFCSVPCMFLLFAFFFSVFGVIFFYFLVFGVRCSVLFFSVFGVRCTPKKLSLRCLVFSVHWIIFTAFFPCSFFQCTLIYIVWFYWILIFSFRCSVLFFSVFGVWCTPKKLSFMSSFSVICSTGTSFSSSLSFLLIT